MFGLQKLTFKAKVIIVSVIVIIISMGIVYLKNKYSITVVKIDDWVLVASNAEGTWYYKSNSVYIDDQTKVIKVWIKIVYTDKGKQEILKTNKEDKYKDIDRSLSMVSINYQKMKYYEDRVIYYSNSDNIIGSDELSVKHIDFIPKSVGDKLLLKILEDYNIKR
ncbi:MAG: hypothetical protein WC600_05165 [Desulfobaccales bacterium]